MVGKKGREGRDQETALHASGGTAPFQPLHRSSIPHTILIINFHPFVPDKTELSGALYSNMHAEAAAFVMKFNDGDQWTEWVLTASKQARACNIWHDEPFPRQEPL